ncbi:MAG TPA: ABC transporter permease [Verrucomicrobiae bacterium]|nr:ABC transporter permease [Verrucomicrobiae bacterium]
MTGALSRFGAFVLAEFAQLGGMLLLLGDILKTTFTRRPRWSETIEQTYKIGWKSQLVVLTTGAFTGMVFTVQTGLQFHKVKMDTAVGPIVSIAMARELAPVLTALMVAGRVGAAIAAELGTMKVTEQLDAMRSMGTSPVNYLAVPRFVAMLVALPLLTAEAVFFGIYSGYLVAVNMLGIDRAYFLENMFKFTAAKDVISGLIKSVFFAMFIALISCYKGFNAGEGAEGVGRATTQAVVVSSLTVLVANFFIAVLFNAIIPP